ncbi:intraflagellar transport protein 25 homolog isoform X2 [Cryptotermes secundus]|uniref:intraflagellar transport protein 25 homolog isoform X2 n=1 Tax=Cryptotermes secundus TaxID=105785 RepID=UPI000CD7CE5D|nr:intraflagellar transport protein 25 homolog isoform X2 [Cryptotermes secundus]
MSKVEELALDTKGCVVSYSSSSYGDYNGCSSKIIDGQRNTYWCTTGLYPQSFIITFPNPVIISLIKIRSYLVQLISVERSSADAPQRFENLCETELDITDHCHQVKLLHEAKFIARHLRFTIRSGYDHVCAVYRVEVQGVHKSGGNEIRGDESDVLESGGPLTTPISMSSFLQRDQLLTTIKK